MLTIEECRHYLKGMPLNDKEVEEIRNSLYTISGKLLDKYFKEKQKS